MDIDREMATINLNQPNSGMVGKFNRCVATNRRFLKDKTRLILATNSDYFIEAKRTDILNMSNRLQQKIKRRNQTPAEIPIRKSRDPTHRNDM